MLASKSHRIELIACVAVLGGCMKIYPDPELPDIEVEWYEGDCRDGSGNVSLTLTGIDDATQTQHQTVACSALKTTFKDVARERYKLEGALLADTGEEFNRSPPFDLDLRNGIDEHTSIFFGGFANFRIAWTFDMGATCASLGATDIRIDFAMEGETFFTSGTYCDGSPYFGNGPDGLYTVRVRAQTIDGAVVAASPEIPDVMIDFETITNLGSVVLTPCSDDCP
jgi:hypothetical protein